MHHEIQTFVNFALYIAFLNYILHKNVCLFKYIFSKVIQPQNFYEQIYEYIRNEKNMANEYPNIFGMPKDAERISEYIRLKKERRIVTNMNIFVSKYSNIFECPNIRYTLKYS